MYKNLVFTILLSLFVPILAQAEQHESALEVAVRYQGALNLFELVNIQNIAQRNALMPQFFLQMGQAYQPLIKQLQKDIEIVAQESKKLKRQKLSNQMQNSLKNKLSTLYKFLKKYRLPYEVTLFHQEVHQRWDQFFATIEQAEDVISLFTGIHDNRQAVANLKECMKKVEKDFKRIDNYEYQLHTDWIDLKLANYVLKIELIRLRNAILFHPLYKKTNLKLSSTYPR